MKREQCKNCNGKGFIPCSNYKYPNLDDEVRNCYICKGTGSIKI